MNRTVESIKRRLYEIIEAGSENDPASKRYDTMITVAVIAGLVPLTIKENNLYIYIIDYLVELIFIVDYAFRLGTADYKMGIKDMKAYIAYAFTPLAIIDFLSLLPIFSILFPHSTFASMLRVLRVLQVFKMVRYSKTMVSITNVIRRTKQQLVAVLVLALVYIATAALLVFNVEPDTFPTFMDALYWATVSITTIGYGDYAPVTQIGRILTMISALVGTAIIALPTGIITAAYMNEITKKKSKHEL